MSDLTSEELDRLYEWSKHDRYIAGSEVRQMIGMIRRSKDAVFQAKVEAAYILAAEISKNKQLAARIEQLEAALRSQGSEIMLTGDFEVTQERGDTPEQDK